MQRAPLVALTLLLAACGESSRCSDCGPGPDLRARYDLKAVDRWPVGGGPVGVAPRCPSGDGSCGAYVKEGEINFLDDTLLRFVEVFQPSPGIVTRIDTVLRYRGLPLGNPVGRIELLRQPPLADGVDSGIVSWNRTVIVLGAWRDGVRYQYRFERAR